MTYFNPSIHTLFTHPDNLPNTYHLCCNYTPTNPPLNLSTTHPATVFPVADWLFCPHFSVDIYDIYNLQLQVINHMHHHPPPSYNHTPTHLSPNLSTTTLQVHLNWWLIGFIVVHFFCGHLSKFFCEQLKK